MNPSGGVLPSLARLLILVPERGRVSSMTSFFECVISKDTDLKWTQSPRAVKGRRSPSVPVSCCRRPLWTVPPPVLSDLGPSSVPVAVCRQKHNDTQVCWTLFGMYYTSGTVTTIMQLEVLPPMSCTCKLSHTILLISSLQRGRKPGTIQTLTGPVIQV